MRNRDQLIVTISGMCFRRFIYLRESPQTCELLLASLPAASGVTAIAGIISVAGFPSVAPTCKYIPVIAGVHVHFATAIESAVVVHGVLLPVSRDYLIIHREHIDCQSIVRTP